MASSSVTVYETLIKNDTPAGQKHTERLPLLLSLSLSVTYTDSHNSNPSKQSLSLILVHKYTHALVLATGVIIPSCLQFLSELAKKEGTRPE